VDVELALHKLSSTINVSEKVPVINKENRMLRLQQKWFSYFMPNINSTSYLSATISLDVNTNSRPKLKNG